MSIRPFVLFLLLVSTLFGGQLKNRPFHPARTRLARHHAGAFGRNYDVRRLPLQRRQEKISSRLSLASEPRRLEAEAYLQALSARTGEDIHVHWNDFGLAKSLFADRAALSSPSDKPPREIAFDFLRAHPALFPLDAAAIESLQLVREARLGAGTHLTFQQMIRGVPVFRGRVKFTVDGAGRVWSAGLNEVLLNTNFDTTPDLTPDQAVQAALRKYGKSPVKSLAALPASPAGRLRFRNPVKQEYSPVEPVVFPLDAQSARPAWRIYLETARGRHYETLIDAATGALLYSQNLVLSSGKARVWKESPLKGPRELVDLPDAWLAPGTTVTTGNNVDAYLDADGDDAPDPETTTELADGRAFSASQFFVFLAGEGSTGQDPAQFKPAAVTNLFYYVNLAHDHFYGLGFNEAAGNFQKDNLNRGGAGDDPVLAEAQDLLLSFEGGSFTTLPEGESPRMQVGVDPGPDFEPTDDRDGSYSGQLVVHEYAHGVTVRLVGGPSDVSCLLAGVQSGGLAEGYSDYFAISYYDNPVLDSYTSRNEVNGFRRYSYEGYPLTYEDLGNDGFEFHNDGEIWAATLWELRKALGQQLTDKLVVDSLLTLPCKPTMVDARDAIINADTAANGGANRRKIWEIFSMHGLGHSSRARDAFPGVDFIVFDAAYDMPPEYSTGNRNPIVISLPKDYAMAGQHYLYVINASDPDGDRLTYELVEGPEGMTVDANSGRVDWTPTFTARRAKIRITDGKGGKVIHGLFIPTFAILEAGQPMVIDGPSGSLGIAVTTAPAGKEVLQVTLRGGTGDPDITLMDPVFDFYGDSVNTGPNETISVPNPQEGFWGVLVEAFEAYEGVTLNFTYPAPVPLAHGAVKSGLSGEETSETFFKITVPDGASRLRVTTKGGAGDLDLLVRNGKIPECPSAGGFLAPCEYDDGSFASSNDEEVQVIDVAPGEWFIDVRGFAAFQGATLAVSLIGPDFTSESITNGASFLPPVSPGAIFTIFGKKLAAAEAQAGETPLPTTLSNTSVTVNGVPAPLYYVDPLQVNAQIPYETQPGEATVIVKSGDLTSDTIKIAVLPAAPGIFLYNGDRAIAVNHEDGNLNDPAHPVKAGGFIIVYLTGVGPLDGLLATGAAVPYPPLFQCTAPFSSTIGGKPAEVAFLGMTPGFVGLGQANIKVPLDLAAGNHPLKIKIGNVESNGPLITVAVR